jgi:hypothetical protein
MDRQIEIGNAVLLIERLLEIITGRIFRYHLLESLERVVKVSLVLENFAHPILGLRRKERKWPAAQEGLVGFQRGIGLALGLKFMGKFQLIAGAGGGNIAAAFVRPAFAWTPDESRLGERGRKGQREETENKRAKAQHGG